MKAPASSSAAPTAISAPRDETALERAQRFERQGVVDRAGLEYRRAFEQTRRPELLVKAADAFARAWWFLGLVELYQDVRVVKYSTWGVPEDVAATVDARLDQTRPFVGDGLGYDAADEQKGRVVERKAAAAAAANKLKEAAALYEQAVRILPKIPWCEAWGGVLDKAGRAVEAQVAYARCRSLSGTGPPTPLPPTPVSVWTVAASNGLVAYGGSDGLAVLYDVRAASLFGLLRLSQVSGLRFSEDGAILAVSSNDQPLGLYTTEPLIDGFPIRLRHTSADVFSLSETGDTIVDLGTDGILRAWHSIFSRRPVLLWEVPLQPPPNVVALDRAGKLVAAGFEDGNVKLFDAVTGKPRPPLGKHDKSVAALAFSPDGTKLASGAIDVRVWDVATAKQLDAFDVDEDDSASVRGIGRMACVHDARLVCPHQFSSPSQQRSNRDRERGLSRRAHNSRQLQIRTARRAL